MAEIYFPKDSVKYKEEYEEYAVKDKDVIYALLEPNNDSAPNIVSKVLKDIEFSDWDMVNNTIVLLDNVCASQNLEELEFKILKLARNILTDVKRYAYK